MKKKVCLLLALFISIIIPSKVLAISGKINLSCTPAAAYPNDSVTCVISGDVSDGTVTEFSATTTLSDNLEFSSATVSEDWNGTSNGGIFSLKASKGQQDSFEIASFTVKIKSDSTTPATVTLNPTKFGEISNLTKVTQTIKMASNVEDTADPKLGSDTNTDVENPDTGSNIPFMIIGGGLILVVILFQIATKSKRISKI